MARTARLAPQARTRWSSSPSAPGIGAGIVLDGVLLRGAKGIAGEIGYLPSFADNSTGSNEYDGVGSGPLERYVAKHGIMSRYEARSGSRLEVHEIFAAATAGDARASEVLDDTARPRSGGWPPSSRPSPSTPPRSSSAAPSASARSSWPGCRAACRACPARPRPGSAPPAWARTPTWSGRQQSDSRACTRPSSSPPPRRPSPSALRRGGDSGRLHRWRARRGVRSRQSKRRRLMSASNGDVGRQVAERLQEGPRARGGSRLPPARHRCREHHRQRGQLRQDAPRRARPARLRLPPDRGLPPRPPQSLVRAQRRGRRAAPALHRPQRHGPCARLERTLGRDRAREPLLRRHRGRRDLGARKRRPQGRNLRLLGGPAPA